MTSPPTGLLGVSVGGDSTVRMIAFQLRLRVIGLDLNQRDGIVEEPRGTESLARLLMALTNVLRTNLNHIATCESTLVLTEPANS